MICTLSTLAILLFLLPRPVHGFGRRGPPASEPDVTKNVDKGRWSSTGARGLDRTAPIETKETVKASRKSPDDIDHPDRAFLEHHPYASGVFTMDPNLYMMIMN